MTVERRTLEIAGTRLGLATQAPELLALVDDLLRGFLADGPPPESEVELELVERPHDRREALHFELAAREERIEFRSPACEAWFDARARRGRIEVARDGETPRDCLANFLRWVWSFLAAGEGRVVLHASGVESGGRGWVFAGPSGAGKSTVALLSRGGGRTVLNDDLVLVAPDGERAWVSGTPFSGDIRHRIRDGTWVPAANRAAPLAALLLLIQAPEHGVERLEAAVAAGELAASVLWIDRLPPARVERALETLAELARRVPCARLRFRQDVGFWPAIEALGAEARA